jgi:hypothetical protein
VLSASNATLAKLKQQQGRPSACGTINSHTAAGDHHSSMASEDEENREEGELSEEGELPDDEPAEEVPAQVSHSS